LSQPNIPARVRFCALRAGRCNAQGSIPAGATNSWVSNLIGKLIVKPVIYQQGDIDIPDGCGGLPYSDHSRSFAKRYDLELDVLTPDPELAEMLLAKPLIVSTSSFGVRTVTDGATTSGVNTLTSATAAWSNADIGAVVAATGIVVGSTIQSITSATVAVMSNNATATGSGVSVTITRPLPAGMSVGASIGSYAPRLNTYPVDFGVSLEFWSKALIGGSQAQTLPWFRTGVFQSFWEPSDDTFDNAANPTKYMGFAVENLGFGTGPGRDWFGGQVGVMPSAAMGSYRDFALPAIPAAGGGYVPVVGAIT
jgi:hypothetical protein